METLSETTKLLIDFRSSHILPMQDLLEIANRLETACAMVKRSWSGSFAGWHGGMYFRNFEIPSMDEKFNGDWGNIYGIPNGWVEKQPEEVEVAIEGLVGGEFSAKKFEIDVSDLKRNAETLRDRISNIFSAFNFDSKMDKERELLEEIEKFSFSTAKARAVRAHLTRTIVSRDTEALRQGIYNPTWLYYEIIAQDCQSLCEEIHGLISLATRLVERIDRKMKSGFPVASSGEINLASLHPDVYAKCRVLFESNAFPEAVEMGFKIVRDRLRRLTSYETGSEAFGKGALHIKGAAAPNVEEDFNNGVRFLTMAIDRFRNEKSHTSDSRIEDPVRAYEYLRLSSLAMNLLDNSEIRSSTR